MTLNNDQLLLAYIKKLKAEASKDKGGKDKNSGTNEGKNFMI